MNNHTFINTFLSSFKCTFNSAIDSAINEYLALGIKPFGVENSTFSVTYKV